jgi:hypothetical protein
VEECQPPRPYPATAAFPFYKIEIYVFIARKYLKVVIKRMWNDSETLWNSLQTEQLRINWNSLLCLPQT